MNNLGPSHEHDEYFPARFPQDLRRRTGLAARGYGTRSEYVRELILKNQQGKQLSCLLLEGASSASAGLADAAYFERLRHRVEGYIA